jgi:hypothetical protein
MGTAYSQWLKAKEGTLSAAEINLERRLHELLLHQQRRQDGVKKQAASERQRHKRRALAPEVPNDCKVVPLPQEVVSDECIAVLEAARAAKEVTIKAYIARALAAEPVVDMMDATVCGTRHQLPRVSLTEALSVQEFKAIEKQYVSARHLPHKKALIQRTQKVLEQVEQLSGVKDSDYAVVDATGFLSGIFVRKAYSCAGRRGRRALAALNFMKGMQGYMKCCSGSGALTGHDERNLLKYKERLVAYGLSADKHPTELAISGTLERPQNGSAQLYYYEEKNGRCHSFQAGAWLARRELLIEEVRHELGAFGLEAHLPDVLVFLEESKRVLRKYGALLLVGGQDEVPEDQIDPELDAELLWKILSMVVIDSGNKSRFGVHTDTPQIAPCLCTAESMYAPGFYDYTGGELCFYNGMYADDYGPEGCLLLSGHRAVHAPLPLRPSGDMSGMPMMRFSLVAWSHAGDTYPGTRDKLEMYRHQYAFPDSDPLVQQLEAALQDVAHMTVGAGKSMEQQQGHGGHRRGRSASAVCALEGGAPAAASAQTLAHQIVGQLGMRLRLELKLRGGGGKCKKKSAA